MEVNLVKILLLNKQIFVQFISLVKKIFFKLMELLIIQVKKMFNFSNKVDKYNYLGFKSLKQIKLCENASEIYSHNHSILALSACIY